MNKTRSNEWIKVTKKEVLEHRKAYKAKVGRPFKSIEDKGIRISLVVDPKVLKKFKDKSKKKGVPYQTLINALLKDAA